MFKRKKLQGLVCSLFQTWKVPKAILRSNKQSYVSQQFLILSQLVNYTLHLYQSGSCAASEMLSASDIPTKRLLKNQSTSSLCDRMFVRLKHIIDIVKTGKTAWISTYRCTCATDEPGGSHTVNWDDRQLHAVHRRAGSSIEVHPQFNTGMKSQNTLTHSSRVYRDSERPQIQETWSTQTSYVSLRAPKAQRLYNEEKLVTAD